MSSSPPPYSNDDDEEFKQESNDGDDDCSLSLETQRLQPAASFLLPVDSPTVAAAQRLSQQDRITSIDGCNLWSSWTRNYSTPLLAFWDLCDNALDASCPTSGRIVMEADCYDNNNNDNDDDDDSHGMTANVMHSASFNHETRGNHSSRKSPVRGMTITNSCRHRIADLQNILKAYNSEKGRNNVSCRNTNSIGEKWSWLEARLCHSFQSILCFNQARLSPIIARRDFQGFAKAIWSLLAFL
jgi:hypothetical protein